MKIPRNEIKVEIADGVVFHWKVPDALTGSLIVQDWGAAASGDFQALYKKGLEYWGRYGDRFEGITYDDDEPVTDATVLPATLIIAAVEQWTIAFMPSPEVRKK